MFGSCICGDEDEHSDLDPTVVLRPGEESSRRDNLNRRVIAERFVLLVDLLICSYETFATYRPSPNSMLEDSEVLYDRRAA